MAGLNVFFGKRRAVTQDAKLHRILRLAGDRWTRPHPAEREMLVKLDRASDFFSAVSSLVNFSRSSG